MFQRIIYSGKIIMASPGQKHGRYGHLMAGFDNHSFCARCRDKGKGKDPCVGRPESTDYKFCNSLTSEQPAQLSTPSYKLKKEKREAKKMETTSTPTKDSLNLSLVDPASVLVIGAVDGQVTLQSPGFSGVEKCEEKKVKASTFKAKSSKDKPAQTVSDSSRSANASADSRFKELDQKWSEHFQPT